MKGKIICTFAMGSRALYDWLDDNVTVQFERGEWVNDPAVVRQNSRMVSLNTCLMVDFTGQVASESIGTNQYSGTGGQTDTAVGAVGRVSTAWASPSSRATAPPRAHGVDHRAHAPRGDRGHAAPVYTSTTW